MLSWKINSYEYGETLRDKVNTASKPTAQRRLKTEQINVKDKIIISLIKIFSVLKRIDEQKISKDILLF